MKILLKSGVMGLAFGCLAISACTSKDSGADMMAANGSKSSKSELPSGKPVVISNTTSHWKTSAASDSESLRAYRSLLAGLDEYKIESIGTAKDELLKRFSVSSIAERNDAVRLFRGFSKDTLRKCDHAFYNKGNLQRLLDKMASATKILFDNPVPAFERLDTDASKNIRMEFAADLKELSSYVNSGAGFVQGEGMWYLQEDPAFFVKLFQPSENNDLKEFYSFLADENRKITEDAGLTITWDELAGKILRWEKFKNSHPDLLETKTEVAPRMMQLVGVYLVGLPNTRAFDRDTYKLEPELKKSYESFIEKNKDASVYGLISNAYAILKKHDFKLDPELEQFLKSQGVDISNLN